MEIIPYMRPFGVDADSAFFQHVLSQETVVMQNVDTVVTALGHQSENTLSDVLSESGYDVHLVGDCLSPRTVEEAVLEGLKTASIV